MINYMKIINTRVIMFIYLNLNVKVMYIWRACSIKYLMKYVQNIHIDHINVKTTYGYHGYERNFFRNPTFSTYFFTRTTVKQTYNLYRRQYMLQSVYKDNY